MSYILDALKKSERKRPPGPVPDLFTVQGPLPPAADRRRRAAGVAALAIVGLAAVLGWGWFQGRSRPVVVETPAQSALPARPSGARDAAPAPAPAVTVPSSQRPAFVGKSDAAGETPRARGGAAPKSASSSRRALPSTPPAVVSSAAPAPAPLASPAAAAPPSQPAVEHPISPEPQSPSRGLPAQPVPLPASAPPPVAAPAVQESPQPVDTPAPVPASAPAPAERADTVRSPAPVDAAPEHAPAQEGPPADSRVVGIEELPADVRTALGKFSISGHVWSEEPSLRLLTVQDRIVREGGEAAPGVRLEEITQAGAVFTVRGWRFRAGF